MTTDDIDISEERVGRMAAAVYLATEKTAADDISATLRALRSTLTEAEEDGDAYAELAGKRQDERDKWKKLADELAGALGWYRDAADGCRKFGDAGDAARADLDKDGGSQARAALNAYEAQMKGGE